MNFDQWLAQEQEKHPSHWMVPLSGGDRDRLRRAWNGALQAAVDASVAYPGLGGLRDDLAALESEVYC